MLFGTFRRWIVVVAAGFMAGSALAVGVPSLVLHNPHSSAAAATATITLSTQQFGALTFAHFGGITNDEQDQQSCSSGTCTYTPTAVPPTVTLTEPFTTGIASYQDMMSWEALMREGNPTGRMDATLTLTSSAGATIATYELENAWPTNVDVPAGTLASTAFTVTLTCDSLVLTSS